MEVLQRISRRQLLALRLIEKWQSSKGAMPLKDIAMSMGIKPPSALEILRPLESLGLIERISGKSKLSKAGEDCLIEYRRRHRLVEILLASVLDEGKIHEAAIEIDMSVSKKTADSVCVAMGHPDTCPHGEDIAPCDDNLGDN